MIIQGIESCIKNNKLSVQILRCGFFVRGSLAIKLVFLINFLCELFENCSFMISLRKTEIV